MALMIAYGTLLFAVLTSPSILAFWSTTYAWMAQARFVGFLASVAILVALGRGLKKRSRPRFWPGMEVGAVAAFLATGVSQFVIRLPRAQAAFMAQLPGVPRQAALTMLHLHAVTGTILSGLMAAVGYGALGGLAAWWGGRTVRPPADPS